MNISFSYSSRYVILILAATRYKLFKWQTSMYRNSK